MKGDIIHCDYCGHKGPAHTNGHARWCPKCGLNNRFTVHPNPKRFVNGNLHQKNMEKFEYEGLIIVTESPGKDTVRVTVYKGDNPTPITTELYGHG